jgi:hypothetical protein
VLLPLVWPKHQSDGEFDAYTHHQSMIYAGEATFLLL